MVDNPKVSSITYVKNGVKYIRKCVESIINQTLHDIEIIIVDGGSNDGTVEILNELKEKDPRIQLIQCVGSVGAQFNIALRKSKGEFIAVCEGDDFILNDKYERQYELAHKYNLDVLRAAYYLDFDCNNEEYRYLVNISSPSLYGIVFENNEANQFFLSTFVNGYWNGLYSREFLISKDIHQNETKGASFQDITFSFLTQLYARRYMFVSQPYHCYRIDNPEASVNSLQCIEKLSREYDLLKDELIKRGLWNSYSQMFLVWEISSYKQFLDKFSQNEKAGLIGTIYERLISQNIANDYGKLDIYHKTKSIINALYSGKESFFDAMTHNDEYRVGAFDFFRGDKFEKTRKVIMFGAGHFGSIVYDFLTLSGKTVTVVDNSVQLQSSGFMGAKVYPAEKCLECNEPIIVVSVEYSMAILSQLLGLGVDKSRIIVCEYEDLFLREIYMKSKLFI